MTQEQNNQEDILLKLSMPGKSLRIDPKDAPKLPEQEDSPQTQQPSQQTTLPAKPAALQYDIHFSKPPTPNTDQSQPVSEGIVPPANTPPKSEEAQDDILRKLSMKPRQQDIIAPEMPKEQSVQETAGIFTQTAEEERSNKPYVSTDPEVERIKKLAQNIYSSDLVQKRLQKNHKFS